LSHKIAKQFGHPSKFQHTFYQVWLFLGGGQKLVMYVRTYACVWGSCKSVHVQDFEFYCVRTL